MGNLLTEDSALKSTRYAYNAQNRLIYCEVTDKSKKEYAQTSYAYDAFGRRVIVQDKGEIALRTLYDGLTFDVIKQSPTFENGLFTDSQNTGIRWSNNGKPTGERYRYIGDEERHDNNRYIYLDENSYKTTSSRYQGERTQINVNGTLTAQSTTEGTQYFTTDLFGSVTTVSDNYGYQLDCYTYDAFGSLVQGSFSGSTDFGYLGKQSDPTSRLYNYGYRDYKPEVARFTTVDPIRDGKNWFAYVNNDPVNHIDIFGLFDLNKIISGAISALPSMAGLSLNSMAIVLSYQDVDEKLVMNAREFVKGAENEISRLDIVINSLQDNSNERFRSFLEEQKRLLNDELSSNRDYINNLVYTNMFGQKINEEVSVPVDKMINYVQAFADKKGK
jgi:RHS repeat-associated protein